MYKLVCFDLDGSVVDLPGSSWELFHKYFHVPTSYHDKTISLYKEKKFSYKEWVDSDIKTWIRLGMKKEDFQKALVPIRLIPNANSTLATLKKRGYKLAIISGSLNIVVDVVFPDKPFDYVFVNKIFFDESGNISSWEHTIHDYEGKLEAVKMIATEANVTLGECVFVGDNINDITVLKSVGFGIAFNPKSDLVEKAAKVVIKEKDLSKILEYL